MKKTIQTGEGALYYVGVDIGGTFTDLLWYDGRSGASGSVKSLTTYDDLSRGVLDCIQLAKIDAGLVSYLFHGTTIVINTVVQKNGSRTALVTTEGFRDVLEIARTNRPEPYNLSFRHLDPLVSRTGRFEVRERIDSKGAVLTSLDMSAVDAVAEKIREGSYEAVAVALFNSYANPDHEQAVVDRLRDKLPGIFVTASHELSREMREFERTSTAVVNAYVGPIVASYLKEKLSQTLHKEGFDGRFFVMESNGGVMAAETAVRQPALLMESGPVAGVVGSVHLGRAEGLPDAISFDMGGTTAKCCLIEKGKPNTTDMYFIGGYRRGYPVQAPMVDVVEVGAGGGSIAWLDETEALRVGPKSAGSEPGPVSYGRGGTEPTVTDANVVLGRIDPDYFLGGEFTLDVDAARKAIDALAGRLGRDWTEIAEGIVRIANFIMAGAVRRITVERGRDPRDFAMVAQGGGGPIHAVDVARELGITTVLVPNQPSTFSAAGMLCSNIRHDFVRSVIRPLAEFDIAEIDEIYGVLQRDGRAKILEEAPDVGNIEIGRFADMRYKGQEHTLKVEITEAKSLPAIESAFETEYTRRYGHVSPGVPIEVVALRAVAEGVLQGPHVTSIGDAPPPSGATPAPAAHRPVYFAREGRFVETAIYFRRDLPAGARLTGPAVIQEYGSTTVLHPGDKLSVGESGVMTITVAAQADA